MFYIFHMQDYQFRIFPGTGRFSQLRLDDLPGRRAPFQNEYWLHLPMKLYACAYMIIYMCVRYVHAQINIYRKTCTSFQYIYIYIYVCKCMCIHIYINVHIQIYIYTYLNMHIYYLDILIYKYIHIYIYIYTCMYITSNICIL